MSMVFPILFLIWCLILWLLFGLYTRVLTEVAADRMVLLYQNEGGHSESRCLDALQQIAEKSGIGIRIDEFEIQKDSNLVYTTIQIHLVFSHSLWGIQNRSADRNIYEVCGARIRNTLDLLWAIGEELPYTGKVIHDYERKMEELRNEIRS